MSSRPAAPPPVGQLVDVGGYRLHLACQGDDRPTVVMEAAIGETGLLWSLVLPAVAQHTRACVYDRAGPKHVDTFIAEQRAVQAMHAELAGQSSRGRLVVAHDSGHSIQLERPQLVVDAIAEVVAAARTGSGEPTARANADKEGLH